MPDWSVYTGPFGIENESCHVVEYMSVDRLGNEEEIKWQCMFVDKTPPIVSARTGDPSILCEEGEGCDYWIRDHVTEVSLGCYDPEPHPSGVSLIEYRWRLDGGLWTDWTEYEEPIVFLEDSVHDLEYRCTDNVGKMREGPGKTYRVDSTPPEIKKTVVGPQYGDCPPEEEGDVCFIDGVTEIEVDTVDPDPTGYGCNIGGVTCQWGYWLDKGEEFHGWYDTFPIQFPEETEHNLVIECQDALGNTVEDREVFYVDKTAPGTIKLYGEPMYPEEGYPRWITSDTEISLEATDEIGPHDTGVKATYWRSTLVEDENCWNQELCQRLEREGDWVIYDGSFTIPEDSCHLIEYFSVDNVDKTEEVNRQCVFVDNIPPEPVKEVGEPKEPWDGLDANFYDLDEFCQEEGACWKTTLLTPISLQCVDPEPHPVNNEKVCFKIELDAEDATEMYCDEQHYNGEIGEDGYCCMEDVIEDFYFNEVSEHNLAYYCVDALGNKGSIDDEKFKVEETAFEIEINRKWNLISTPVSLLDDSMGAIFDDLDECVQSVWGYDSEADEWHVYTPGVGGDIDKMLPGWGYWVLADEDCTMLIGGSLMSPAMTPPSKDIVAGWNLIGYYGADGQEGYYGPQGNGGTAQCELFSLGEDIFDKEFTSLMTYWEPDNPNSWKELGMFSNMDPGAGYWMFTPSAGIYAPSTSCGLNVI
jgi:hypothetical protein